MKLHYGLDGAAEYRGGYVAIGNFDGVHRGHQAMIAVLVRRAHSSGVPAVVFTFHPHPVELLRPEQMPPSLSTVERKTELLGRFGVDAVIAYPTDTALLELTPEQFFDRVILGELDAKGLVEGPNFFFGHDRAGDVGTLKQLCDSACLTLDVVEPVKVDGQLVSSSLVRARIADGNVAEAVALLGHPYRIHGEVVKGAGRGSTLGFPTANLREVATLMPADGVYAGIAHFEERSFAAAINVGANPTFDDDRAKLEVHLIGFSGNLYEEQIEVDFLERIRGVEKFENGDALRQQLERDVELSRDVAKRAGCQ